MFETHAAWIWLVAGLVLAAIELAAPGAFLIWIGAAALTVGALSFVVATPLSVSLTLFAALSVVFALFGRRFYGGVEQAAGAAVLNDRARSLIGRAGVLETPIGLEPGRVRFDDTHWRARGPDLPSGARIKVTGVASDGATLLVEAA
ncbi:MAG: NfeD family protein [Rhodoblastus sp.]|nr:MAG: NfeD family protein [Rhodoblastus sp.]